MARFRLERVRRVREQFRRQAERTVSATVSAIAANAVERAALRAAQAESWSATAVQLEAGTTVDELALGARFSAVLEQRAAVAATAATRLEAELVAGRARLMAARLEERKVERLREQWATREAASAQRVTNRLLDDLALRQFVARK